MNEMEFHKMNWENVLVSLKPRSMKLVNKNMLVWIGVNEIVNDVLMVKIYLMIWSWLKYIWVFELLKNEIELNILQRIKKTLNVKARTSFVLASVSEQMCIVRNCDWKYKNILESKWI